MQTVHMLQAFPNIANYYRNKFRHILVDEYQDTNHAQYVLIRELTTPSETVPNPANLTVVGDSDQSVYAFRGANIRNIIEFTKDYPNAKTITLEQNYRSTQNILDAANTIISKNKNRSPKNLWTNLGHGEKLSGYIAENENDEAQFVVQEILQLQQTQNYNFSDTAIFYRTNAQSRNFEDALIREGVPYKIVGGMRFYDRQEIKDIVAYLRIISNPEDVVSLRRVLNVPKRGVGVKAETNINTYAQQKNITFHQALLEHNQNPNLGVRCNKSLHQFLQLLADLRSLSETVTLSIVVEAILEQTNYLEKLQSSSDVQDMSRIENLAQLVTLVKEFENYVPEATLEDFLEKISLVADNVNAAKNESGAVTLMTLHSAKGLEFPIVFLTGMEEGIFPHARALDNTQELEEERRLAYVGVTRAKKKLYLTCSWQRSFWGQTQHNPISSFVADIPQKLLNWFDKNKSLTSISQNFTNTNKNSKTTSLSNQKGQIRNIDNMVVLVVGDKVKHNMFGVGKIIFLEGTAEKTIAKVAFESGEHKRLLLRYAPLTKI